MFSKSSVSPSDGLIDDAVARAVETQLQARREEFAQGISRYAARICAAMSITMGAVGFLAPTYPQLLIYAVLILLLALGAGVYPSFQRRNRASAGFSLILVLSLVVVSLSPLLIPGLLPVIGITDVVAVMVAILILGERRSRWLLGAFALAYLADVVVVDILEWSPFPALEHSTEFWITGIVSLIGVVTIILAVRLAALGLEQQFRRTQRLNFELERRIREGNETKETLNHERNMLRTLIDHVPDYIFIKDKTKRFILSNQAQAHAAGVASPSELLGFPADIFFPANIVSQPNVDDEAVLLGASILAQERQTVNEDGTLLWLSTTKVPLRAAQGEIIGIVGISRDITAYKQAEEALQRERNLLRLLIDTVPANVYIKDAQSRFVEANLETALQMGGKTPSDLIGKTDFDFFSTEMAGKYFADERAIVQSGLPLRNIEESNFDQRTQQKSWFLTTKVPILDEQGEMTGLVGVGLDITERKQAQEQIAQERNLLRTLIDHLPDYIFIKDSEGRFLNSNAAHNQAAHVKDESELRGKTALESFPADLAGSFNTDDQLVLKTGQALVNIERTSVDAQGQERTVLTTKVPLFDASGTVTGLVGISRDISERKQVEQQTLELQNERQRVEVLHQFIGDATHDLMTPIAGINLSIDLARRAPTPERLSTHLNKIEILSEKLQDRLQDMLTMSQLDMMAFENLELRTVDLAQMLKSLIETFRPRAQAKEQQLSGEVDPQAGTVQADYLYLVMALAKVVENAIHYTEKGGTIHISIARREARVAIAICDTGIGIAEDELTHIFERFYRAKSHRPLDSGAGLGLSIAQRILDLHHGRIEVSSVVGSGSTFTILLPGE